MWFIILTFILIAGVYLASDYYFIYYYNTHHIKIDNMHKIKTSNNSSYPKS